MFHRSRAYNRNTDKHWVCHMAWVRETIPCIIIANFDMQ